MDITTNFFTKEKPRPDIIGVEKIALCYWLFTTVLALVLGEQIHELGHLLLGRLVVLIGGIFFVFLYKKRPCKATFAFRIIYQMALLSYWYPDTYNFCQVFPNLDYIFASVDQAFFDSQPAITLNSALDSSFWVELFCFGYLSYFPMIVFTILYALFFHYSRFEKTSFIVVSSFFFFYLIYLFLPVTGPQYYFQAIGINKVHAGMFPALGDYFRTHTAMLPFADGQGGFFQRILYGAHMAGERPTAAFPSSHVGISSIVLFLMYRMNKKIAIGLIPLYLILCISTVYVQAHYAIDVVGGWLAAWGFYKLSHYLNYTKVFHHPHGFGVHRAHSSRRRR